jgi:hypothetical protein
MATQHEEAIQMITDSVKTTTDGATVWCRQRSFSRMTMMGLTLLVLVLVLLLRYDEGFEKSEMETARLRSHQSIIDEAKSYVREPVPVQKGIVTAPPLDASFMDREEADEDGGRR